MEPRDEISFHEAGLASIDRSSEGAIRLLFEDVSVGTAKENIAVHLNGIRNIICDGSPSDAMFMEYEDGEVLTLTLTPTSMHLIVEWNDFRNGLQFTRSYAVECEAVALEVIQDPGNRGTDGTSSASPST